jgi:hypothetical protein
LKLNAVPLPDPDDPEFAELMLEWSPLERLRALPHYARMKKSAG